MKPSPLSKSGNSDEKFLDLRQSREEGSMAESRLRSRGGVENDRLQALNMYHLRSVDVDKEVKMLQEISSEKRN